MGGSPIGATPRKTGSMSSSGRPSREAPMCSMFTDREVLKRIFDPPADPLAEYEAVFPLGWYETFLQTLRDLDVQIITYDDLFDNSDDWDFKSCYQREFDHWHEAVRDPSRTYLLIQHDVDFVPTFTKRMVALEASYGIRSNVFIFNELYDVFPDDSPYDDSPYDVDHAFFQRAQTSGFVIGYHQNALALAGPNMDAAVERFQRDVAQLSRYYPLRFFCPHGGPGREIDGKLCRNYDVPLPAKYHRQLRWVYNKYAIRFAGRFSDGGLRRLTDPKRLEQLDLVDEFVKSMQPGKRYFALIHPQLWGYNVNMNYNPLLAERPWYQDVCRRFGAA